MKRRILKGCGRDLAHNFIRASGEQGFGRLRNFISTDGGARNFTSAYAGRNFIKIGSGQNFISAQGGLNFISADRARNFNFINDFSFISAARNFTLALFAACILSGCDSGSDAQDREQSARSEQNFSAGNQGRNFNKSTHSSGQGSVQNSAPQGFERKRNSDLNSPSDASMRRCAVPSMISCGDVYTALLIAHDLLCRADEVSPKGALINGERIPYRSKIVACAHFAPAVAAWIKKTAPRAVYLAGRLSVRSADRSHTRSARQPFAAPARHIGKILKFARPAPFHEIYSLLSAAI